MKLSTDQGRSRATAERSVGKSTCSRGNAPCGIAGRIMASAPHLLVVGSINADLYFDIERLPKPGETIGAGGGDVLPGGKVRWL